MELFPTVKKQQTTETIFHRVYFLHNLILHHSLLCNTDLMNITGVNETRQNTMSLYFGSLSSVFIHLFMLFILTRVCVLTSIRIE